jgi:hypothetical protein
MRKDEQPERHHPEAKNGKKTEETTADQRGTGGDSSRTGARHRNLDTAKDQTAPLLIEAVTAFRHLGNSLHFGGSASLYPRHPDGEPTIKNKVMTFFLKNRLANGASISITPLTPRQAAVPW